MGFGFWRGSKSFKNMTRATTEQLGLCPGLGEVKVRRLYDAFHLPFRVGGGGGRGTKRARGEVEGVEATTMTTTAAATVTPSGKGLKGGPTPEGEQLTLSDVGLSMGLSDAAEGPRKRKRDEEVVVVEDDEPAVQGSPDWPEIEEEEGQGDLVWRDPLASDSD